MLRFFEVRQLRDHEVCEFSSLMRHKFLVIDFDKPTARVYMGSYNFSIPADVKNGENLSLIGDRRIAVSYLVEALSMLDHYHFRVAQKEVKKRRKSWSWLFRRGSAVISLVG